MGLMGGLSTVQRPGYMPPGILESSYPEMSGYLDSIRGFATLRALIIGDAMLDTYMEGRAERLCSEGPVPVVQRAGQDQAAGGAANTALNAAIGHTVSVDEISVAQWEQVIGVNLRGPFLMAKTVFPHMREQGGGSLLARPFDI
jgi:hypothetical protein